MNVTGVDGKAYQFPDDVTDQEITAFFEPAAPQPLDTIPSHSRPRSTTGTKQDVMGIASPAGRAQAAQVKKPLVAFAESVPVGAAKIADTAAALVGSLAENPETSLASKVQRSITGPAIKFWEEAKTPEALPTVGQQVAGSLGELAPTLLLGPAALPTMAGTATYQTGKDLVNADIPLNAAQTAAAMQGLGAAAMSAIPGAAPTLGKSALLALTNPVTGIAQRAATQAYLEPYDKEVAAGFDPLDPASLALDVAMAIPGLAQHPRMKAAKAAESASRPAEPVTRPEPTPQPDYTSKQEPASPERITYEIALTQDPTTSKAAMMMPQAEGMLPLVRQVAKETGLKPLKEDGSYYLFNPEQTNAIELRAAIKNGTEGQLLGYGTDAVPAEGIDYAVSTDGRGTVDLPTIKQWRDSNELGFAGRALNEQMAAEKMQEMGGVIPNERQTNAEGQTDADANGRGEGREGLLTETVPSETAAPTEPVTVRETEMPGGKAIPDKLTRDALQAPVEPLPTERIQAPAEKPVIEPQSVTGAPKTETTSIKNAVTDAERAADGLPPIETPPEVKPLKTSLDEGKRMVETGEFSPATVDSIIKTPHTLSDSENMALLYMKQRNRNAHDTVTEKIIEARQSGDVATIEALKAERDAVETERQNIDMAGKAAGTEWGRAGRARQEEMAQDYSLQRNIQRARAESPSGEITDAHRAEIESLTKRLETVMKEAETKDEMISNLQTEMALKAIHREESAARRKGTRAAKRETLDAEFTDLTNELNAILNPNKLNMSLDPAVIPVLVKMARNRVRKGMLKASDVVDSIHVSIEGALDKREIRDAISGYGKQAEMKNDPESRNLREMRAQLRLVSALEDATAGKLPMKSGLQRPEVSPSVHDLQRQVKEAMEKSGLIDPAKTDRQAVLAAKKSIAELSRRIKERIADVPKSKSTAIESPELKTIRAERDALKEEWNKKRELFREMKRKGVSDEAPELQQARDFLKETQRQIKAKEKAIARSIEDYKKRISTGKSRPEQKTNVTPDTPEISKLTAERDVLMVKYKEMVEAAKVRKTPEEISLQAFKTRLTNRIAELEKKLETGDFSNKPRSAVQLDAPARRLKAKEEDLKRQIDAVVHPVTAGKKARAAFTEAWKAGLLSGPKTHIVNITSNALTVGLKPIENLIASGIDSVRSKVTGQPREVFSGEAKAGIVGLRAGVDEGFRRAARGWAEALPPEELLKVNEAHNQNAIGGRTGKIVRLPLRALSAADGFFKGIAQSSEVYRLAFKKASSEGLTGEPLKNRMTEIIQEPGAKIIDASIKEADYRTFNSEFGPFGKWVASSRRIPYVGLVADILMPFVRTPINIAKYGLERTPVNYGRLIYKAFKGELKGGPLSEEMAKPLMGTMITAAVVNGVISGYITGGGPKDKADKETLYRTGWQPYSFKIGDKYYSYNRFEPVGMVVGSTADFADLAFGEEANVKTATDAANVVALSIAKNWTSKTFMQSLSAALDATSDPGRYGQQFISQYAGSLIPSVVNTVNVVVDENRRDVKSTGDAMKNRIPGMSDSLEVKLDLWGRPLKKPGLSAVDRALSPIIISKASNDPVDKEMLRLGLSPGMPTRKLKGNELSQEQYSRYVETAGQKAYENVSRIVKSGSSDEQKKRQITNVISKQREITGRQLMRDWGMTAKKKE